MREVNISDQEAMNKMYFPKIATSAFPIDDTVCRIKALTMVRIKRNGIWFVIPVSERADIKKDDIDENQFLILKIRVCEKAWKAYFLHDITDNDSKDCSQEEESVRLLNTK